MWFSWVACFGDASASSFASYERWSSAQRFDKAPKLDSRLGSGTVAVIAIPLAVRIAASPTLRRGPAAITKGNNKKRFDTALCDSPELIELSP
jgi:hypothetical protein